MDFENIYRSYSGDIYSYAYFKLRNKHEAEDVVSEAFTRVIESENLNNVENMKNYIFGIARNIIYSKFKKQSKEADLSKENKTLLEEKPSIEDMEGDIINSELIKSELDKLDDSTREVIILKVWEEMTFDEISDLLDQKVSTVKLRYYRGLEQIKVSLNSKSNKKYVIAFPSLLSLIGKVKAHNEFTFSRDSQMRILENLNYKSKTMDNLSKGQANAASKVGFLSTPAKLVITALVAGGVITSLVVTTAINNNTEPEPTPTPTIAPTEEPEPTDTPQPSEEPGETNTFEGVLLDPSIGREFQVTFEAPVPSKSVTDEAKMIVSGAFYDLYLQFAEDRTEVSYTSYELVYTTEDHGDVYLVSFDGLREGEYYLTNNIEFEECLRIASPCGSKMLSDDSQQVNFTLRLSATTEEGLNEALQVAQTFTAEQISDF